MDQIHLRLEKEEAKLIQKKAADFGLTTNAFIRQIMGRSACRGLNHHRILINPFIPSQLLIPV